MEQDHNIFKIEFRYKEEGEKRQETTYLAAEAISFISFVGGTIATKQPHTSGLLAKTITHAM